MSEGKKTRVSEQQLMHIAQQEEQNMLKKQNVLERLSGAIRETIIAKETLKELKANKGKIMVNIGATILIEAEPINIEKCKRGFGEHAYKEETTKETIEWLETKEEQLKKQLEKLGKEYTQTEQKYTSIIGLLKQIEQEKKKQNAKAKQGPITISK